ncbi:MAG: alpha/beta fold hydrolase [Nevskiales bacterium]
MSTSASLSLENSTIVRFNKSATFRWLQKSFAAMERHAPSLGARWAEYLWFRIPRGGRVKEPDWLTAGKRLEIPVNGRCISARIWGSGPRVYLVHGWGGSGTQLSMFVPLLLESGYSVVSFDVLGHGASAPGPMGRGQGSILDFSESLKAVIAELGPAHAIIAHWLGSTAVARALRDGVAADRLVFLAPMANPARYLKGFVQLLGGGERIFSRLRQCIEARVGVGMETLKVAQIEAEFQRPLLIFHDRDDRETSWSDGAAIAHAWSGARLVTTVKLGHRRILSSPSVVRETVRFIQAGRRSVTAQAQPARKIRHPLPTPRIKTRARPDAWLSRLAALVLAVSLLGFADSSRATDSSAATPANAASLGASSAAPLTIDAAALQVEPALDPAAKANLREERRQLREQLRGLSQMQLAPPGM